MANRHLIMILEAPMQSWGLQGKFDRRDTMSLPTKSGVLGLLGAALGVERNDVARIKELTLLKMSVLCLKSGELMTDYHTIGGGYEKGSKCKVLKADGNPRNDAVITHRDYLFGSSFAVVLSGDASLIDESAKALDNPKWPIFLGRRCCIPTRPVLERVVDTQEDVKAILRQIGAKDSTIVMSDAGTESPDDTYHDVPIDYSKRQYGTRSVVSNQFSDW